MKHATKHTITMFRTTILILLILLGFQSYSQDANARAKAYFLSAQEAYNNKNYDKAIDYCGQIEEILGGTNAMVEALLLKSYHENGNTEKALESLQLFYTLDADESLVSEVAPYIVKIEEAERARLEKLRAEEEARIMKEQAEAAERQRLIEKADFNNGLGRVEENGKYGFIDEQGNVVIPFQFSHAYVFVDGMAFVAKDSRFGAINKKGEEVIPFIYDQLAGPEVDINGYTWFSKENTGSNRHDYPYSVGLISYNNEIIKSFVTSKELDIVSTKESDRRYIYFWAAHFLIQEDANYKEAVLLYEYLTHHDDTDDDMRYKSHLTLADLYYLGKTGPGDIFENAYKNYQAVYESHGVSVFDGAQKEAFGDICYYGYGGTKVDKEKALEMYETDEFSPYSVTALAFKHAKTAIELKQLEKAAYTIERIENGLNKDSKKNGPLFYLQGLLAEAHGELREAKLFYKKSTKEGYTDAQTKLDELKD